MLNLNLDYTNSVSLVMQITEFRITLPMSLSEYKIAQRFVVAEYSKSETGGGEGIQIIKDEPYQNQPQFQGHFGTGQYTEKFYNLASKLPETIQKLVKSEHLEFREFAWNAFPYVMTKFTNPSYMKENFLLEVETMSKEGIGSCFNVVDLSPAQLEARKVIHIDIVNDSVNTYKANEDPTKCRSFKTRRGPLTQNWIDNYSGPLMTCYKVVRSKFQWWGLQTYIESKLVDGQREYLLDFHRKMFCWMDRWYGLTMQDILDLELRTRLELDYLRMPGKKPGHWSQNQDSNLTSKPSKDSSLFGGLKKGKPNQDQVRFSTFEVVIIIVIFL